MRRFQTLGELIGLYAQPNQGLVCALLLPVEREREPEPPDDRDISGAARLAECGCLPCPFPRHCLLLASHLLNMPPPKPPAPNRDAGALYPTSMEVSDSHSTPILN